MQRKSTSKQHVLTSLPTISWQETLHCSRCGPASLKIVAAYFGLSYSEEELAAVCRTRPHLGTSDRQLVAAGRKIGFTATIINSASYRDIEYWVSRGLPPIVNWFTRGRSDYGDNDVPDGHYSVVVGLTGEFIILEDPEIGHRRILSRADFRRVWFDFRGDHIRNCSDLVVRQLIVFAPTRRQKKHYSA